MLKLVCKILTNQGSSALNWIKQCPKIPKSGNFWAQLLCNRHLQLPYRLTQAGSKNNIDKRGTGKEISGEMPRTPAFCREGWHYGPREVLQILQRHRTWIKKLPEAGSQEWILSCSATTTTRQVKLKTPLSWDHGWQGMESKLTHHKICPSMAKF